jgi:hypothetical protein
MPPRFKFTPEAMAGIRYLVEETDQPMRSIALGIGISKRTLERICEREKIRSRERPRSRNLPTALKLQLEAEKAIHTEMQPAADTPSATVADRLENAVEKELAAVELMRTKLGLEPSDPVDTERTARTLERLTETLLKIRRWRLPDAAKDTDYELPKDIDEFRHSLARRIEAFVRSRADIGISDPGESGGAAPSQ